MSPSCSPAAVRRAATFTGRERTRLTAVASLPGPNFAQVDYYEAGKGSLASKHSDPGQCHSGHEQERNRLHQLPGVAV